VNPIRIGCSGWQYKDWRNGVFYPPKMPTRHWLMHYAQHFDTVEVNATFYRLAKPEAVARWVEETPPDFVFAVKGSRYLTHMKRLTGMEQGVARFFAGIAPLAESPKLGPVLWQLPPDFRRDDERLANAIDELRQFKPTQHCFEFRHESWFHPDVLALLRERGVALAIGDDPRRPQAPLEVTANFSFVRLHYGRRGRRGNYSETELREWADRLRALAREAPVYAYFNNDWEGFAIRNARRMKQLLGAP
jgi:uncharacterized protein YecE (DUF72 family)